MDGFYYWKNQDLFLQVKVQPGASRDEIAEIMGDSLKIRIMSPPVDGKANQHLIAFLARSFKVAKNRIELISGQSSREKKLVIHNPGTLPDCIKPKSNKAMPGASDS